MSNDPCANHTNLVMVSLDLSKIEYQSDGPLVAGLVRACAEYADGPCAIRHATDANLITPGSFMYLWFSSTMHAGAFKWNLKAHLSYRTYNALTVI